LEASNRFSGTRAIHPIDDGIGGQEAARPQRLLSADEVATRKTCLLQSCGISRLLELLEPEIPQIAERLCDTGGLRSVRSDLLSRTFANQRPDARRELVSQFLLPLGLGMSKSVVSLHLVQIGDLKLGRLAHQRRDALPCPHPRAVEAGPHLDWSRGLLRLGTG
jgi:hypothetical protein